MESVSVEKNIHHSMRILTGIAIVLVVLGHADFDALTLGGLFPYYSYHVMVFMFVSGYFYKSEHESQVGKYIIKKARHLLIPYYICNIIFGIIATMMVACGFEYVSSITLKNLLLEPFLGGHQYGLNFAAWFVPALFLIEIVNICMRKILGLMKLNKDWLVFLITQVCGIATVWLSITGHVWGWYKTPGRILFMLPVYEFGRFYKSYLEERIKSINTWIWLGILIAVQIILFYVADGNLNFSAVWCTGFASLPVMPYLTTFTGTMVILRISEEIENTRLGKGLETAGNESFWVMMFHPTVFFLINMIAVEICTLSGNTEIFDWTGFKTNVNYTFLPGNVYQWKIVYVTCGILIPIFIKINLSKVVLRIRHR